MDENTNTTPEQPSPPAGSTPPPPAEAQSGRPGPASDTSKLLAALGYPFFPVAIVALFMEPYKDEKFVKFHAVQALALAVIWFISLLVPFVGWVLAIVVLVFIIIGLIKALQSEYYEIPVIYSVVKGFIGE